MTTEFKYICECSKKVVKKNIYGEIIRNDAFPYEPIYELVPCQYKTNDSSNFKKHQLNQHDYCKEYNCSICNLRFNNSRTLSAHNRENHPTSEELKRQKIMTSIRNKRYRDSLKTKVSH